MLRIGIGLGIGRIVEPVAYAPPAGNVVTNWRGTGTGGTNGLPDGWTAQIPAGVTLSVLSRTPYRGGNIIEFQFAGTASANGNCGIQLVADNTVAAAPAQVWRSSVYSEAVGAQTPAQMAYGARWRDSGNVSLGGANQINMNGAIAGPILTPADSAAPALTAWAVLFFLLGITSGQTVQLRYKVFAPTLTRIS